jgi:hypothetical protein
VQCCVASEENSYIDLERLQTNQLGTALLSLLLVPYLSLAPKTDNSPRIVVLSSDVHYFIRRIEEADSEHILMSMNNPEVADMNSRYYTSKCDSRLDSFTLFILTINWFSNEHIIY